MVGLDVEHLTLGAESIESRCVASRLPFRQDRHKFAQPIA
jgi:hypothetical protein